MYRVPSSGKDKAVPDISYSSVWSDSSVNNADISTFGVNSTKRV